MKELELNGFISRKVFTGTPVVIEYELTRYAQTLDDVLDALSRWGTSHRDKVRKGL